VAIKKSANRVITVICFCSNYSSKVKINVQTFLT
jgi:hypothetical protein